MNLLSPTQTGKISRLLQKQGVVYAGLFGSQAKGTARKGSDYDFLIEFSEHKRYSFFDLLDLIDALKTLTKTDVDVVTTRSINKHLKSEILHTVIPLYDQR